MYNIKQEFINLKPIKILTKIMKIAWTVKKYKTITNNSEFKENFSKHNNPPSIELEHWTVINY